MYNTAHLSIGQTGSCGRLFGRLKSLVATHVPVCKRLHRQISTTHKLQGSFWGVGGALPTDGAVHSNLSYYSPTLLSSHDTSTGRQHLLLAPISVPFVGVHCFVSKVYAMCVSLQALYEGGCNHQNVGGIYIGGRAFVGRNSVGGRGHGQLSPV